MAAPPDRENPPGPTGAARGPDSESLVGEKVGGRYEVVALLGRGGMGAVYEARGDDGKRFALKVIRPEVHESTGRDAVRRFLREARAVEQIDDPHVTRVVDAGTDEARGFPFIVMELLEGRDLGRLLTERGPLEALGVVPLFVQACQGLTAAHARGLVHRDIKPANLFVVDLPSGDVALKVCDFGVAKQVLPLDEGTDLTRSGGFVGSPMYMSPEQARNSKNVDLRSDVFSLAVSLYETVSGKRPWPANAVGELVLAMWSVDPVPLTAVAPWVAPELAAVVHKALARLPGDRFASAADFGAALAPFGATRVSLDSLTSVSDEKKKEASTDSRAWAATAVASTMLGGAQGLGAKPAGERARARLRRRSIQTALVALAVLAAVASWRGWRARPIARWWSGSHPTLAIPYPRPYPRVAVEGSCPEWFGNAVALGTASELAGAGGVRMVGPRPLSQWTDPMIANGKVLGEVAGADAVAVLECRAHGNDATVKVRIAATRPAERAGRELASFEDEGTLASASELAGRVTASLRSKLGLATGSEETSAERVSPLPSSRAAVEAFVEATRKADARDFKGARTTLQEVTSAEPRFAPAHALMTEVLAASGHLKETAEERVLASQNAAPLPDEERLIAQGELATACYSWNEAIDAYKAALKVFPDRTDVALRLVDIYLRTFQLKEARETIDALLVTDPSLATNPRVMAASASSDRMANPQRAVDEARVTEQVAHADGIPLLEKTALVVQCSALNNLARLDEADRACTRALALAEQLNDLGSQISVLSQYAYLWQNRSDPARAKEYTDKAFEVARRSENLELQSSALLTRANGEKRRAEIKEAIADARGAIEAADASGSRRNAVGGRVTLAGILFDSGATEEGGSLYQEALPLARANGDNESVAIILQNLGFYWLAKGDVGRARQSVTDALDVQVRIQDEENEPWSLDLLAVLDAQAADTASAKKHIDQSIALRQKLHLPITEARNALAGVLLGAGEGEDALRTASATADEFHAQGEDTNELEARTTIAHSLLFLHRPREALDALDALAAKLVALGRPVTDLAPARARALFLVGQRAQALTLSKPVPTNLPMASRARRLVADELALRMGQRDSAIQDLQALASETHAAGDFFDENAANALIAGHLDDGFR